jgi:hypothetical protein
MTYQYQTLQSQTYRPLVKPRSWIPRHFLTRPSTERPVRVVRRSLFNCRQQLVTCELN